MELPERSEAEQKEADEFFNKLNVEFCLARRQEERDYLDRVALEAMKLLMGNDPAAYFFEELAGHAYGIARAMLAARSLDTATPKWDVDDLSNFIRQIDGNNKMGAGMLAENIFGWLRSQGGAV